jgi:hypothetical protein
MGGVGGVSSEMGLDTARFAGSDGGDEWVADA